MKVYAILESSKGSEHLGGVPAGNAYPSLEDAMKAADKLIKVEEAYDISGWSKTERLEPEGWKCSYKSNSGSETFDRVLIIVPLNVVEDDESN